MEGRGDESRLLTVASGPGALIKTPKEREVKLSKAKMLNVATPRRSLGLGTFRRSRVSWAAFQPIISNG